MYDADDAANLCIVCMGEPGSAVLAPCGHKVLCQGCCQQMMAQDQKCPISMSEDTDDSINLGVMCMENPSSTVLVPCGHKIMCKGCCDLTMGRGLKCPTCQKAVEQHIEMDA